MARLSRAVKWGDWYVFQGVLNSWMNTPPVMQVTWLSSASVKKPVLAEVPKYVKLDHEYKVGRKYTIQTLENLFGIKTITAFDIAMRSRNLCKVSGAIMRENFATYLKHNITSATLLKYPELLSETVTESKIKLVSKLPYDINDVAVLISIPVSQLEDFVYTELSLGPANRISMLSNLLKISVQESCTCFCKKTFLRSIPIEKLQINVGTLKKFGISSEQIRDDLWVLRYSNEQITSRLSEAKNRKVDNLKTWMVRAQPDIFETYIKRRSEKKSILGDSSLAEYLSERLQCSVEIANYIILKQPALKNKSLKKLNEIIDFLFAEGFKPHHVCRVPKILLHSVDTTKKRLKQLEDKGIQIDSLYILTKSWKQFTLYYEALIKSKNKKNKI